ncbi:hypothetical protein A4G99_22410 [Haladaptatus sp. R4]|nr:hypothetical protein A4G99_22410 [Haladaptatus sp. R4]
MEWVLAVHESKLRTHNTKRNIDFTSGYTPKSSPCIDASRKPSEEWRRSKRNGSGGNESFGCVRCVDGSAHGRNPTIGAPTVRPVGSIGCSRVGLVETGNAIIRRFEPSSDGAGNPR